MKRLFLIFAAALFVLVSCQPLSAAWRTIEPGLEYEARPESLTHVFRIDPRKIRIGLLLASDFDKKAMTASDFRERANAVLAVNGGFFDEVFRSMGLLYRDGKTLNPVRPSAWGILVVSDSGASIVHRTAWNPKGVMTALQAGPRLVIDGTVPRFKAAAPDRRSAVGVTGEGKVVIAVTNQPMVLSEWANLIKQDCTNAINLDGGGSTQLSALSSEWSLSVEGLTAVPNALALFRRY